MTLQASLKDYIARFQDYLKAGPSSFTLSHGYELVGNTPEKRAARFKEAVENVYLRLGQIIDNPNGDVQLIIPWMPKTTDVRIQQHFSQLQIPTLDHKPSLLLHGLGDPNAFDFNLPRLASGESQLSRATVLRSIFPTGRSSLDPRHSVLFNTSGAGKTRLVLQGLCEEWGFYLTCSRQASECGSADIEHVLHPHNGHLKTCGLNKHPTYPEEFEENGKYAERCFTAVMTARFLVLLCLLAAFEVRFGAPTDSQLPTLKRLWLLVQLDTRLLEQFKHPDILSELTTLLCHVEEHDTLTTDYEILLNICRDFLGPTTRIYCVLDEAQTAANSYCDAFVNDKGNKRRPTLRAMLKIWNGLGMQHVTTGTSLNLEYINDALSSTISKHANTLKQAVTDTGSFVEDASQIEGFLRHYLPSWLLESESGKELIERAKYWLYGRPRFITSYVSCLIENNLQCPHQVLTKYIKTITKFVPTDAEFWEKLESSMTGQSEELEDSINRQSIFPLEPFDLTRAMDFDDELRQSVQKLVYHRLIGGRTDFESSGDGLVSIDLVECGFARYPSAAQGKATFDEPLAYLAADYWIAAKSKSKHQYFVQRIHENATNNNGLECYTAMCLAHIFREFTPLSAFFDFANIQKGRRLASKKARLVSCWINANEMFMVAPVVSPLTVNEDGGGFVDQYISSPSKILGHISRTPDDDVNWLNFRVNAPFLFPQTNFGPDLIFRLQLEGGKLLTVALQTKYKEYASAITTPHAIQKAVNSVDPDHFYRNTKGKPYASESYDDLPKQIIDALDRLPQRYGANNVGYHSLLCGFFTCPTVAIGKSKDWQAHKDILEKIDAGKVAINRYHEFFVIKFDAIRELTRQMLPKGALDRLVKSLTNRRIEDARKREEIEKKKHAKKLAGKKTGKKRNVGV